MVLGRSVGQQCEYSPILEQDGIWTMGLQFGTVEFSSNNSLCVTSYPASSVPFLFPIFCRYHLPPLCQHRYFWTWSWNKTREFTWLRKKLKKIMPFYLFQSNIFSYLREITKEAAEQKDEWLKAGNEKKGCLKPGLPLNPLFANTWPEEPCWGLMLWTFPANLAVISLQFIFVYLQMLLPQGLLRTSLIKHEACFKMKIPNNKQSQLAFSLTDLK